MGVVTSAGLISKLGSMAVKSTDPVSEVFNKTYPKVSVFLPLYIAILISCCLFQVDTGSPPNLGKISQLLEKDQYVIVIKKGKSSCPLLRDTEAV